MANQICILNSMISILLIMIGEANCSNMELLLINNLEKEKNLKTVRPALNDSDPVIITIGLTLSQLVLLDAKNQILTTNTWIRQVWHNPYLRWNASAYGGIKTINIDPTRMWLPDITLYNNAEGEFGGSMDKLQTRVILEHTGKCTWLAPAMVNSKCEIDIAYFPFDTQNCILKFGSWTYDKNRLDLQVEAPEADLTKYMKNAEWKLINMTAKRNIVKYICCPEAYPDITFTLVIKRRSLFYLINLIIPLVMISALACMTFLVPFESGERVSLSITVLLSMTVFMLLVQDMIPPTSDGVPLVAQFYTAAIIEMGIGVMVASYNLHLYFIDPQFYRMPLWMKGFVLGKLSILVGVKTEREKETVVLSEDEIVCDSIPSNSKSSSTSTLDYLQDVMDYGTEQSSNYQWEYEDDSEQMMRFVENEPKRLILRRQCAMDNSKIHSQSAQCAFTDNNNNCNMNQQSKRRNFARRKKTFSQEELESFIKSEYHTKATEQKIRNDKLEWRQAAMILDKLCFYLFILMFLVTVLWIFLQAPGYVE